eukprot:Selendium_serpulae@DN5859_c0_g1_i4.p1
MGEADVRSMVTRWADLDDLLLAWQNYTKLLGLAADVDIETIRAAKALWRAVSRSPELRQLVNRRVGKQRRSLVAEVRPLICQKLLRHKAAVETKAAAATATTKQ